MAQIFGDLIGRGPLHLETIKHSCKVIHVHLALSVFVLLEPGIIFNTRLERFLEYSYLYVYYVCIFVCVFMYVCIYIYVCVYLLFMSAFVAFTSICLQGFRNSLSTHNSLSTFCMQQRSGNLKRLFEKSWLPVLCNQCEITIHHNYATYNTI